MDTSPLITDALLARMLRVPVKWLREEAEAARLPCVKAGSRYLFNRVAVEATLAERAAIEHVGETTRS